MRLVWITLFALVFTSHAHAYFEHGYGLGASAVGRAGSVTADIENPYAAVYNPALLSASSVSTFSFSLSAAGAEMDPFSEIQLDSPEYRTTSGLLRSGDVHLREDPNAIWAAGVTHPFYIPFARRHRAGWGLAMSGPMGRARRFKAGTPYDFGQLRYGTADSQFKGTLGVGFELIPDLLSLGAGASVYLTGAGSADATVVATNPTARLLIDVAFNASFIAGLFAHTGPWNIGLSFRDSIDPRFTQQFTGRVELGGAEVVQQPMLLQTSLYYEPAALDLDVNFRPERSAFSASVGLSYQRWAGFQPSYLVLETVDNEGRTRRPELPALTVRDTVNPRASLRYRVTDSLELSAGYSYRPTPLTDLSGPGNLLDSDVHVWGLSAGYGFAIPAIWPEPMRLGVYGQYHLLSTRVVTKSNPEYIGAPGYTIQGRAYIAGLELSVVL